MPQVQNPSLGAGQVALQSTTTQLTRAQILSLDTVPVTLIPAPGAGKLINVFGIAAILNFGTVAYSSASDVLSAFYENAAFDAILAPGITDLVTNPADSNTYNVALLDGDSGNLTGNANAAIQIDATTSYNVGPIVTATLGAGGLGYIANDTGTIANGNNDATYKVLTVGAGGAVLTFQITVAGTLCSVANGNATVDGGVQPGVGVGFTVNITAVQTGDGTLKVVTYYQIIPVP